MFEVPLSVLGNAASQARGGNWLSRKSTRWILARWFSLLCVQLITPRAHSVTTSRVPIACSRSVGLRNMAQAAVPKNVARPKASKDNFCSSASEPKFWIEFKSREETGECQGCIGSPQGRPEGRRYRHAQYICRISWPLRGRVTRRRPSGLISPNLQDWIQMRFQVHTESAPDSLFKTCGWFQWFLNIFSRTPGSKWLKVTSHPSLSQKLPGEKRGGPGKHHSVPFFQGNCGWFTGKADEVNSNFFSSEPQRSQCWPWSFCHVHSLLFFFANKKSLMLDGRCSWVPNFLLTPHEVGL